jgi:hypothetical protein
MKLVNHGESIPREFGWFQFSAWAAILDGKFTNGLKGKPAGSQTKWALQDFSL